MKSLLCDEVWLSSPAASPIESTEQVQNSTTLNSALDGHDHHNGECHMSIKDCEQALIISLDQEEKHYLPNPEFLECLLSNNLIVARFKSIQWFIKCRSRLNLSFETIFYAANYLDRFLSLNQYDTEWQNWMVELLSVACLSIASKFRDSTAPTLHEISQIMEDMEHSFEPSTIQKMELRILHALDWRLACTTAYSYLEMFTRVTFKPHLHQQIVTQVYDLLLRAISDTKMMEYRPSVVALSALCCCLDKFHSTATCIAPHSSLSRFFNQDQKDDLVRCKNKMMKMQQWIGTRLCNNFIAHKGQNCYNYCPASPTTVLLKERIINNVRDHSHVDDLSLFQTHHPQPQLNLVLDLHQSRSSKKPRTEDL